MEIKNKLTVSRGEGDKGERRGRVKSRNMYIKDPWPRTMVRGRIECGRGGWAGQGRAMGEKWDNHN